MSSEREGLRTSNLVHRRITKTRISDKVKGQGRSDASDKCWPIKSRMKRRRKTKIGRKIVQSTSNNASQIQGQRSKVKVTRPTNAETGSASYLLNGNE